MVKWNSYSTSNSRVITLNDLLRCPPEQWVIFRKHHDSPPEQQQQVHESHGQRIQNFKRTAHEAPQALAPLFFPGSPPDIPSASYVLWALTTHSILPFCWSHLAHFHLHDFCTWLPPQFQPGKYLLTCKTSSISHSPLLWLIQLSPRQRKDVPRSLSSSHTEPVTLTEHYLCTHMSVLPLEGKFL